MATPDKLERTVQTGQDNTAEVAPFRIYNLRAPKRWDPGSGRLMLEYDIEDPNHLIRSGRVLYYVRGEEGEVLVHVTPLSGVWLEQTAPDSPPTQLPDSSRWDGTLTQGIPDRKGERITADLSRIRVEAQVWNNQNAQPGRATEGGRTAVPGEWLSVAKAWVFVDVIAEARWARDWVVPYQDPREYADARDVGMGEVGMVIRVKNVRDGAKVRLKIRRIGEIADEVRGDYPYTDSGAPEHEQPGIQSLVVRFGRVVQGKSGADPVVRFNRYEEHWKYPGNNFYMFAVAIGGSDEYLAASERDCEHKWRDCLHMRFTVLICAPSPECYYDVQAARALHGFFQRTRFFRSYTMLRAPKDAASFLAAFQHRYMVLHLGHGVVWCGHPKHTQKPMTRNPGIGFADPANDPVSTTGSLDLIVDGKTTRVPVAPEKNSLNGVRDAINARKAGVRAQVMSRGRGRRKRYYLAVVRDDPWTRTQPLVLDGPESERDIAAESDSTELYYSGFPPYGNVCPTKQDRKWYVSPSGKRRRLLDLKKGRAGCGERSHVAHWLDLGSPPGSPKWYSLQFGCCPPGDPDHRYLYFGSREQRVEVRGKEVVPRFLMYASACRTILTTNLGEYMTANGTSYFFGLAYVGRDDLAETLAVPLFRRWIKGTKEDPAPVEYDVNRFEVAYHRLVQGVYNGMFGPGLLRGTQVLTPLDEPRKVSEDIR